LFQGQSAFFHYWHGLSESKDKEWFAKDLKSFNGRILDGIKLEWKDVNAKFGRTEVKFVKVGDINGHR